MDAAIALLNDSGRWLVAQLGRMSVELTILAGIVLVALYVLRVKSPALRHLFWGLLLAKPVVTFLVASPLSLYAFLWPPIPAVFYTQAPVVVQMERAPVGPPVQTVSVPDTSPPIETPRLTAPPFWRQIDRYGLASTIWMLVASLLGLRLLLGCAYVAFLRSTALTQRGGFLADLVAEARSPLRMRRRVRIATTRVAHGPVLAGIFRPVILLPEGMAGALTPRQLKLVITHELAHARRWDNLVLLIQRFAEMFFFFHPVVWFCGWMMRREAEAACDDMVVSAYGDEDGAGATAYADSLTRVAEMKCGITHRLLVNTFAAAESNFNRRIRRILSGRKTRVTLWLSLATGAVLVLIGVLGLPTVTSAPSLEPSQYAAASFSDLKSLYAKHVPVLSPEIRKYREESPAFQTWREAIQATMPIVVRGERARRQLVQVYAEGKQDPKSLGPEFKVDPKDGDVIGHPLIDQVAKAVFQKTLEEALKVLAPGREPAIELTRGMQTIRDATPIENPEHYKNPYEKGSFASISLDRAMGEAMMQLAMRSGKVYQPLPAPLEEKLRSANAIYEVMKRKASQEKQKRDLPERIDPVDDLLERMVTATTDTVLKEDPSPSAAPEVKPTQSSSEAALTSSSITPPLAAPQPKAAVTNIEKALDAPGSIEFENIHLENILNFIADSTDTLNFCIDWRVVQIPGDMSTSAYSHARGRKPAYVTDGIVAHVDIRNVAWRAVLDRLLKPLGLTYIVREHYVWISSPAMIQDDAGHAAPEPRNPSPALMKALGADCGLAFQDIHVRDFLEYFSKSQEFPIVVDDAVVALAPENSGAAAATGDTSHYVTNGFVAYVQLMNTPALEVLEAVLRPLDLVAVVEEDHVRVTSYDRASGGKAETATPTASAAPPPGEVSDSGVVADELLVLDNKPILAHIRIRGAESWVCPGITRGGFRVTEFTSDPPGVLLVRQADDGTVRVPARQGTVRTELSEMPEAAGLKLVSLGGSDDRPSATIQSSGRKGKPYPRGVGSWCEEYILAEIDPKAGTALLVHPTERKTFRLTLADAPLPTESTPTTATEADVGALSGSELIEECYSGHIDEKTFNALRKSLPPVYDPDTGKAISSLMWGKASGRLTIRNLRDNLAAFGPLANSLGLRKVPTTGASIQRDSCVKNLKQCGLIFRMFTNEAPQLMAPSLSPIPGCLMWDEQAVYPKFLKDPGILFCPGEKDKQFLASGLRGAEYAAFCVEHASYWYLGYALPDENTGLAFVEAYKKQAETGRGYEADLKDSWGKLILRLREGVESSFVTDSHNPAAMAKVQTRLPLFIERPGHHDGKVHVLFMDGHVETLPYPGEYPVSQRFIEALESLDALRTGGKPAQSPSEAANKPPEQTSVKAPGDTSAPWRAAFDQMYSLKDGEVLKRIAPPFIPERMERYLARMAQYGATPQVLRYMVIAWDKNKPGPMMESYGRTPESPVTLGEVLTSLTRLSLDYFELPPDLLNLEVPGDWVVRQGAHTETILKELARSLHDELNCDLQFANVDMERDVIVASGTYVFTPLPDVKGNEEIHFFADVFDPNGGAVYTGTTIRSFLQTLAERMVGQRIIDETSYSVGETAPVHLHPMGSLQGARAKALAGKDRTDFERLRDLLLDNVAKQTGLRFSIARRSVPIWTIAGNRVTVRLPAKNMARVSIDAPVLPPSSISFNAHSVVLDEKAGTMLITAENGGGVLITPQKPPQSPEATPTTAAAPDAKGTQVSEEASAPAKPDASDSDAFTLRCDAQVEDPFALAVTPTSPRDRFEGQVVNEDGEPLAGVFVDAWTWYPGDETTTGADGAFSLSGFDPDQKTIEVRFSKDGYSPVCMFRQPLGRLSGPVTMTTKTYLDGKIVDSQGHPAADAIMRVDGGPRQAEGVLLSDTVTQTTARPDGTYRFYVQHGSYEVTVTNGAEMAVLKKVVVAKDEAKSLDIQLSPAAVFRARVVDSITGAPVEGVRLYNWRLKEYEGTSNAVGEIAISGMPTGKFEFQVDAEKRDVARWWSEEAVDKWQRYGIDDERTKWQRNFDGLKFQIEKDMTPVTITVEKGVRIRGKVIDPDGKPVEGATVSAARTGTSNSLTGDTRFSVRSDKDGNFDLLLPASKSAVYNLICHDGDFREWRAWANGVAAPITTQPGDLKEGIVLQLQRPCIVRGKVVDDGGAPIGEHEVRACAFEKSDNRYYVPETRTDKDGNFELKCVAPGKLFVQAAPFWLDPEQAPEGTSQIVETTPDNPVDGIVLRITRQADIPLSTETPSSAGDSAVGTEGKSAQNPKLSAELPGGVVVELVGICNTSGLPKVWWGPDAYALRETPFAGFPSESPGTFEAVVSLTGREDLRDRGETPEIWDFSVKHKPGGSYGTAVDATGQKRCLRAATFLPEGERLTDADIRFGIALGPWETKGITRTGEKTISKSTNNGSFTMSAPALKNGNITVATTLSRESDAVSAHRVVAVLNDGTILPGSEWDPGGFTFLRKGTETTFSCASIDDIDRVEFQVCDYQWVIFQHIPLSCIDPIRYWDERPPRTLPTVSVETPSAKVRVPSGEAEALSTSPSALRVSLSSSRSVELVAVRRQPPLEAVVGVA